MRTRTCRGEILVAIGSFGGKFKSCPMCRERERVMTKENPDDVMAIKGLCKRYTKKGRLAVDR